MEQDGNAAVVPPVYSERLREEILKERGTGDKDGDTEPGSEGDSNVKSGSSEHNSLHGGMSAGVSTASESSSGVDQPLSLSTLKVNDEPHSGSSDGALRSSQQKIDAMLVESLADRVVELQDDNRRLRESANAMHASKSALEGHNKLLGAKLSEAYARMTYAAVTGTPAAARAVFTPRFSRGPAFRKALKKSGMKELPIFLENSSNPGTPRQGPTLHENAPRSSRVRALPKAAAPPRSESARREKDPTRVATKPRRTAKTPRESGVHERLYEARSKPKASIEEEDRHSSRTSADPLWQFKEDVANGLVSQRTALQFEVEYCTAKRPSATLRGRSASYVEHYELFKRAVRVCMPDMLVSVDQCFTSKRIGSFEIVLRWFTVNGTGRMALIFSKLSSGRFPDIRGALKPLLRCLPTQKDGGGQDLLAQCLNKAESELQHVAEYQQGVANAQRSGAGRTGYTVSVRLLVERHMVPSMPNTVKAKLTIRGTIDTIKVVEELRAGYFDGSPSTVWRGVRYGGDLTCPEVGDLRSCECSLQGIEHSVEEVLLTNAGGRSWRMAQGASPEEIVESDSNASSVASSRRGSFDASTEAFTSVPPLKLSHIQYQRVHR